MQFASLALAFLCAAIIVALLLSRPQKMRIMHIVWPVTALYWGPAGVWGLWDIGTPPASPSKRMLQRRQAQLEASGEEKE